MVPQRIVINKTIHERLEEYNVLLENLGTPCSEIVETWATIFEDLTIIETDWQALWILSEENCQKYNMLYPSAVNDFTWMDLSANVSVIATQEDVVLPEILNVSIMELYPIKDQDYNDITLRIIEDWFDKCRYFFKNLWYPWDAKVDITVGQWCESHLKNRLIMQYDIRNGTFDKMIANYLKSLQSEAQNLNFLSNKNLSENDNKESLLVVKKFLRRKVIETELDLFEDPVLRNGMILLKGKKKLLTESFENPEIQQAKFVWETGNCESLINNLLEAKSLINSSMTLKVYESFQEALNSSFPNNIILLPTGMHVMTSLQGLQYGGSIKGLPKSEAIIMADSSTLPKVVLLSCFGSIELENLTITKPTGNAIQIFDGSLRIKNCKIVSKSDDSSKGIVVFSKGKLNIENCEIQGFSMGIVLQEETCLSVSNSKICNCEDGIKIKDNTSLIMHNVEISCSKFGIQMETIHTDCDIPIIGDLNLLEKSNFNCKFNFQSVKFKKNFKGNVIVKKSKKFKLVEGSYAENYSNEVSCLCDEINDQRDIGLN